MIGTCSWNCVLNAEVVKLLEYVFSSRIFFCTHQRNHTSVWNEIVNSCLELASSNARDTIRQLEYAGVTYVQGAAAFADSRGSSSLFITSPDMSVSTVSSDKILLATGSTPFRPGGIPFDGKRVFDSDSINTLSRLPKSVAITGSGIIAIEFAKIFKNLGLFYALFYKFKVCNC